ncbi:hypothetical protein P9204_04375 [Geobacillus stearothermophilus]|jgi:hypothetical protein|nr:hypothetical protein [Geobacillus stearothermophilus]
MKWLLGKLLAEGVRTGKRIREIDMANPITQDTVSFLIDVAKEIIKPF